VGWLAVFCGGHTLLPNRLILTCTRTSDDDP
jgi:hypothetical protein